MPLYPFNNNPFRITHPKYGSFSLKLSIQNKSIGSIHNWHGKSVWEYYQIVNGKAVKISHDTFHDKMKSGSTINQPLYVED